MSAHCETRNHQLIQSNRSDLENNGSERESCNLMNGFWELGGFCFLITISFVLCVTEMTTMVEFRTVVLNVVLHCEGCARTVKRAIKRIPGASISLSFYTKWSVESTFAQIHGFTTAEN